jgi:hypothetical protein
MSVTFADPTPEACAFIARHIRPLDREELRLTGSKDVAQAIRNSVDVSVGSAYVAYEGEEPIAVLGMAPNYLLGEGCPWMLGTPKVARHPRDLVVHARAKIAIWLEELPLLMNEVWTGNRPALTFLKHIGFSFAPPRQNVYGADMQLFYARRS